MARQRAGAARCAAPAITRDIAAPAKVVRSRINADTAASQGLDDAQAQLADALAR